MSRGCRRTTNRDWGRYQAVSRFCQQHGLGILLAGQSIADAFANGLLRFERRPVPGQRWRVIEGELPLEVVVASLKAQLQMNRMQIRPEPPADWLYQEIMFTGNTITRVP